MGLLIQALRFLSVGLINTIVAVVTIFIAINILGFGDLAANATGYAAGFAIGFVLNRSWTFGSRAVVKAVLLRYAAAFLLSYSINLLVMFWLESIGVGRLYAQATAIPAYTVCFFVFCRWLIFSNA